jgi:hypothetical protein
MHGPTCTCWANLAPCSLQFLAWSGLITSTGFPILMGSSLNWFPSHMAAFTTFFYVGGTMGVIGFFGTALFVHPKVRRLRCL